MDVCTDGGVIYALIQVKNHRVKPPPRLNPVMLLRQALILRAGMIKQTPAQTRCAEKAVQPPPCLPKLSQTGSRWSAEAYRQRCD